MNFYNFSGREKRRGGMKCNHQKYLGGLLENDGLTFVNACLCFVEVFVQQHQLFANLKLEK